MIITDSNLPICVKCNNKVSPGATYISNQWICGICLSQYLKKLEENKLKAILEG